MARKEYTTLALPKELHNTIKENSKGTTMIGYLDQLIEESKEINK